MPNLPFPDMGCFLCDGTQCKIKRIIASPLKGILCNGFDIGGKERCKIFNNAQKEGLILFFK
jgi:hypothetical protein